MHHRPGPTSPPSAAKRVDHSSEGDRADSRPYFAMSNGALAACLAHEHTSRLATGDAYGADACEMLRHGLENSSNEVRGEIRRSALLFLVADVIPPPEALALIHGLCESERKKRARDEREKAEADKNVVTVIRWVMDHDQAHSSPAPRRVDPTRRRTRPLSTMRAPRARERRSPCRRSKAAASSGDDGSAEPPPRPRRSGRHRKGGA